MLKNTLSLKSFVFDLVIAIIIGLTVGGLFNLIFKLFNINKTNNSLLVMFFAVILGATSALIAITIIKHKNKIKFHL